MITDMSKKVLTHLTAKYENVKKGVESVMGGKVLEYEAKTIYNNGIEEGSIKTLIRLIDGKIITLAQAAAQAGLTEDEFKEKIKSFK